MCSSRERFGPLSTVTIARITNTNPIAATRLGMYGHRTRPFQKGGRLGDRDAAKRQPDL